MLLNNMSKTNKATTSKKGGMVMDDISKLVVPFGILLAERSLSKMIKSDKKTANTLDSNRKAAAGGSASKATSKTKTSSKKGGGATNLTKEFNKLSTSIESFLSKY
jgi:hypothetical protein